MQALEIAQNAVDEYNVSNGGKGGISHVARIIGYGRPSLSLYLNGRYTAEVGKIEAAILNKLVGRIACPHLSEIVTIATCQDFSQRQMPTSEKMAFRHWSACQNCTHKLMEAGNA